METCFSRSVIIPALAVGLAVLAVGCASAHRGGQKEERVSVAQLSGPARTTVERVTAGGRVDQITRETERGRTVYDVEATVGGQHQEFLIGASDGMVLGTEVPIGFGDLPEPVRAAAEKYFGTTRGLTAMKGAEYGETSYEIEGPRNGKTEEVTFDPAGKRGN